MATELASPARHPGETPADRRATQDLTTSIRRRLDEIVIPSLYNHAVGPSAPDDSAMEWSGGRSLLDQAQAIYLWTSAAEFRQDEGMLRHALTEARSMMERLRLAEENGFVSSVYEGDGSFLSAGVAFFIAAALADCGRLSGHNGVIEVAAALVRRVWECGRIGPSGGLCLGIGPGWEPLHGFCGPETYLDAMDASSSLLAATGDGDWRKRWLDMALLLVAGFYDPSAGLLGEAFLMDTPVGVDTTGSPVNQVCNFRAAGVLLRTAAVLEEPGFADVGCHLLHSILGTGFESKNVGTDARAAWKEWSVSALAEVLPALAGYYRLRPSMALLNRLEQVWAAIHLPRAPGEPVGAPNKWNADPEITRRLLRGCLCTLREIEG